MKLCIHAVYNMSAQQILQDISLMVPAIHVSHCQPLCASEIFHPNVVCACWHTHTLLLFDCAVQPRIQPAKSIQRSSRTEPVWWNYVELISRIKWPWLLYVAITFVETGLGHPYSAKHWVAQSESPRQRAKHMAPFLNVKLEKK